VQMNYVADNVMEGRPQYDADNWKNGGVIGKNISEMKLDKPFCESFITEQSAKDAYESVMADVGANYPKYDAIDARTVKDVLRRGFSYKGSKAGLPGIPDSQNDVGPYPDLKGGEAPADSDHDGMPDEWEKANGLNPNDPADAAQDADGDGLTGLQEYLAGTSPTNSASSFRIISVATEDNDVRVTWTTGPGKTNALERTAGVAGSFATNSFTAIFTVTNTIGTATNYLDIGAATNSPARYYRVRLVP